MKVKKLRKKLKEAQQELYDLHLNEPSEVYYKKRRAELEFEIAALEDEIEFEKKMLPFQLALIGFVVASLGLFVYAYAATPY
jgi:predicted Zn-dependent protease